MPTETTQEATVPLSHHAAQSKIGNLVAVLEGQGMEPDVRDGSLYIKGTAIQIDAAQRAVKGLRLGR